MSRTEGEVVHVIVNDEIIATVMLVEVKGYKCRLGFEADKSIKIHRGEVWEKILAERANGNELHGNTAGILEAETREASRSETPCPDGV